MKKAGLCLLLSFIMLLAATSKKDYVLRQPANWPRPHYDLKRNPLDEDKILLGRVLFYDPILSGNQTISCASCHLQATAFSHVDHALSHGINDSIGTRNAPSLMNLAWQPHFMWDGAINHLDMQSLFPITHPDEMGESLGNVIRKLQSSPIYPTLFYRGWGDSIVTGEHLLKSISQFMLTLVSADSRYDSMLRKETMFTLQEQNGYRLYKQHCAACHTEPLFTNYHFENNGLRPDTTLHDTGMYGISKQAEDSLKFKVPTLRNVEFSIPYMHDGRYKRLADVLNHYTQPLYYTKTLSPFLQKPIVMSANEKVDLTAFLLTLTDKHYLFNSAYSFPRHILIQ